MPFLWFAGLPRKVPVADVYPSPVPLGTEDRLRGHDRLG